MPCVFARENGMRQPNPPSAYPSLKRRGVGECASIKNSPPDKGEYPEGGGESSEINGGFESLSQKSCSS